MPSIRLSGNGLKLSNMSDTVANAVSNLKHPDGEEPLVSRYKDAIRSIPDGVMAAIYEKKPTLALQWITLNAFHNFKIKIFDSNEESIQSVSDQIQQKAASLPQETKPLFTQQMNAMQKVIEHGQFYAAIAAPDYLRNLFGALKMFIPQDNTDQQVVFRTPANLQLNLMQDKLTSKNYLVATLTIKQIPGEKPILSHDGFDKNAVIEAFDHPANEISFQFTFDLSEEKPRAQLTEINFAGTDKWCDAIDIVLRHKDLFNITDQHVASATSTSSEIAGPGGLYRYIPNGEEILTNYHNSSFTEAKKKNSTPHEILLTNRNLFLENTMQSALNALPISPETKSALSAELAAAKDFLYRVTTPFNQRIDNVVSKMNSSVVGWMHPRTTKKELKLATMKEVVTEIQEKYNQYINDVILLAKKYSSNSAHTELIQEIKQARIILLANVDNILHKPECESILKEPRHPNFLGTKSMDALKSARHITKAQLKTLDSDASPRKSTSPSSVGS